MVIYPVPVEVTQARIQLLVDQTAKAPPKTISDDLKAVYHTKAVAEEAALQEAKAENKSEETSALDVKV
jgi:hypothetical protein